MSPRKPAASDVRESELLPPRSAAGPPPDTPRPPATSLGLSAAALVSGRLCPYREGTDTDQRAITEKRPTVCGRAPVGFVS